jgi:hypothetical protein
MKSLSLTRFAIMPICLITAACNSQAKFASSAKKSYDAQSSQTFNFTSSSIVDGNLKLSDGGRYTSFDVTQAEKNPTQVTQRQIRRSAYNESYTQGHRAKFSTEEFKLSEAGMLDFLVVIDDSTSMDDEQALIAKGLAPLISEFKDTNWQIAVISMSDPCVTANNLIKKTDLNPDAKFREAVKKPWDRDATEQGFPMAIQAFKGQCKGALRQWLRPGSSVGVLFLSDEDNCGSSPGEQARCKNLPGKSSAEMVNFLHSIRPVDSARIYSIVDYDGTCPDAGGKGTMYAEAALQMGGSVASICHDFTTTNGYGSYLSKVSTDVNRILKKQFTLTSRPDMAQFDVLVDGQPFASTGVLSVNGSLVTIDPAQITIGLKIAFSYTHDAVPMFVEVPAQPAPALNTLAVSMGGRTLAQGTDYNYDPVKRVLAFTVEPPEDAMISVRYLEEKTLLTHFDVNLNGVRPDTLKVSVNGVAATDLDYSYDASGLNFLAAPGDGAMIVTSWKTDEQKILSYPASSSDPRHPVAWTVKDKVTGEVIPAQWTNPNLVFHPENVIEKRVVNVEIDFGSKSSTRTLDLPDDRIDDDVKILADGQGEVCQMEAPTAALAATEADETELSDGKNPVDKSKDGDSQKPVSWQSRYKGKEIQLKCKDGAEYAELSVQYKHEVSRTNKFVVGLPNTVDPNDPTLGWRVFLDGKATTQFKRSGQEIEIEDSLLPPATKVDVEVITYSKYVK